MKTEALTVITDLIAKTEKISETVRSYRSLSSEKLNCKPSRESWSILECLEHLNLYGDYYLVEMEHRILAAKTVQPGVFRSGVIGNYFANLMIPKADMKKMKSPKDKNPAALLPIDRRSSTLSATTIERFLKQQDQLLRLLNMAVKVDLTRTRTSISLSPLIKLRLGDTFRFYVYHIERHIAQAERLV